MIENHTHFCVPEIIDELTSKQVLTAELIEGTPLDKIADLNQDVINKVNQENILEDRNELLSHVF